MAKSYKMSLMKILLTGANGYIGQRLLYALLEEGHEVVALVRSPRRINIKPRDKARVQIVVGDLLLSDKGTKLPQNIDAAYYLVHAMKEGEKDLLGLEERAAQNFLQLLKPTHVQQIVYLGGLVNDRNLSLHLSSRKHVEDVLSESRIPVTTLRAGIIIGSGSASFEIIRDLVEKLPLMITPRWVESKCQPIGIADVLYYLISVLGKQECLNETFDIGGPNILSYRQMLTQFAAIRGLKRLLIPVPVLTPKLSKYWLYFVTSTNFALAGALVESLKNNAICENTRIQEIFPRKCLFFEEALKRTFSKIEHNAIPSSWKDAIVESDLHPNLLEYAEVPQFGCLSNEQNTRFSCDPKKVIAAVWSIGGERGWYYMNWAWRVRGFVDQLCMGIGLRRGRTHPTHLHPGDALDFWRVLLADKEQKRLLLYAEMRLPGEAWLEFTIEEGNLKQRATFRPNGLLGRLYWYLLYPIHIILFRGMAQAIVHYAEENNDLS